MSVPEVQAAKVQGPRANVNGALAQNRTVLVLPITTSAVTFDIANDAGKLPLSQSRIVKMTADVKTYYVWGAESSLAISETAEDATTPHLQPDVMIADAPVHEYVGGRYLTLKGTAAGRIRIVIASP